MKKLSIINVCMVFFLISQGWTQDWNAVLSIDPSPSPYISDWQNDPTIASLEITNNTGEPDVVIIHAEITNSTGNTIFRGYSPSLLAQPGDPLTITSMDLDGWVTEEVDPNVENQINRTGMLPEDDGWEVCLTIQNQWGVTLIENLCAFGSIRHPEPPELIYPINNEVVFNTYPMFQWIPPQLVSGKEVIFTLRIVELFPGQTPEMALSSNYPHYENFNILDDYLEYPLDGLPLESNKSYVWQVTALDDRGIPVTKNEGLSEIGQFSTASDLLGDEPELTLIAPEEDAYLGTKWPVFMWEEPTVSLDGLIYYTISIAEIFEGQSPEQAMELNPPHFVNHGTITDIQFTYPVGASELESGKQYAWQLTARDHFGIPVTSNEGKSEIRTFTILEMPPLPEVLEDWLPETLSLGNSQIAYIRLKQGDMKFVSAALSEDSSQITITSLTQNSVPMVFPVFENMAGDIPFVGSTVNLTIDRWTLDILNGQVSANPSADIRSPFNLSGLGLPFAIQNIIYTVPSGGTGVFNLDAKIAIFGRIFNNTNAQLTLTSDGRFYGTISSPDVQETLSLVQNSQRLLYILESVDGNLTSGGTILESNFELNLYGALLFNPDSENMQRYLLDLIVTPYGLSIARQGTTSQDNIQLPFGSMLFDLQDFVIESLIFSSGSPQPWDFDFRFNLIVTLSITNPPIELPSIPSLHLIKDGFFIPQTEFLLSAQPPVNLESVVIQVDGCRMPEFYFDWFHWEEDSLVMWDLQFDLALYLNSLPPRLQALAASPLTVLNARVINNRFVGSIEPREFPTPILAPLTSQDQWGLHVYRLEGALQDSPSVELNVFADFIPPPALHLEDAERIELGGIPVQMSPNGIFTGKFMSIASPLTLSWNPLTIQINTADLILENASNTQAAALDIQGGLSIPVLPPENMVQASGAARFDLINNCLESGQFVIQDPFNFSIPTENPVLTLRCLNGGVVDPRGLHINNGDGQLIIESGSIKGVIFSDDVTLSLPGLTFDSGILEFPEPFALRVQDLSGPAAGLRWSAASAGINITDPNEELLINLPAAILATDGRIGLRGETEAKLLYGGLSFDSLRAEFSSDFVFDILTPGVITGRIDFLKDNETVAYMDRQGFWPGNIFTSGLDLPASARLPLPTEGIAYIQLLDDQGQWLMQHTDSGMNLILSTLPGQTTELALPGLAYATNTIPVVPVVLNNVIVNKSNLMILEGSINFQSKDGTSPISLVDKGCPFEITELQFDSDQIMRASVRPVLPKALEAADISIVDIRVTEQGLEDFNLGHSQNNGLHLALFQVGDYLEISIDTLSYRNFGSTVNVEFAGEFQVSLFEEYEIKKPLSYTADLKTSDITFSVWPTYSETSGYTLPMGRSQLRITDADGFPRVSVQAPFDADEFSLTFELVILSMPWLGSGFNLTLHDFIIAKNGITPPTLLMDEAQALTLFGLDLILEGQQTVQWITSPPGLELTLSGNIRLLGEDRSFSNLIINTNGVISNENILQQPFNAVDNSLLITELSFQSDTLNLGGSIQMPEPLSAQGELQFNVRMNSQGYFLDPNGNPILDQKISFISKERENDQGINLGKSPFTVRCVLAGLELTLYSLSAGDGKIVTKVNSYWPSWDSGIETENLIVLEGTEDFNNGSITQKQWDPDEQQEPFISFVQLLNLKVTNIDIPDTSEFQIKTSGSLTITFLPQEGSNCTFENFILSKDNFTFGTIPDGTFDIYGLTLSVSGLRFGIDMVISDFTVGNTQNGADPTYVEERTADFFLTFSATINDFMEGNCGIFTGGVDSVIVYKDYEYFYLLIDNANFNIGNYNIATGNLDLEALIPLTFNPETFQFQLSMGGGMTIMGMGFAVVGELAFLEETNLGIVSRVPSIGMFFGLIGQKIQLTPLPIWITEVGGGLFFNPTSHIEDWVINLCGLDNRTEWQNEEFGEYRNFGPWLSVFLLGGVSVGTDEAINAKVLYTFATDHIRIDNKLTVLGYESLKEYIEMNGLGHVCIGFSDFSEQGVLTNPYVEGSVVLRVWFKKPPCGIQGPEATFEFGFAKRGNDIQWGIHGDLDANFFSILTANFDLFVGSPGILFEGTIDAGFDISIVAVDAGLDMSIWFVWQDIESISVGGYMQGFIDAEVLWGAAWARGELGVALLAYPEFYFYGYAELDCGFLGWDWNATAWAEWSDGHFDAGTGGDPSMIAVIEAAEEAANLIRDQANEIEEILLAAEEIILSLGLSDEDLATIINNISAGRTELYDGLEDDRKKMVDILNGLNLGAGVPMFNDFVSRLRNSLSPTTIASLEAIKGTVDQYNLDLTTDLAAKISELNGIYEKVKSEVAYIDFKLSGLDSAAVLDSLQNPISFSGPLLLGGEEEFEFRDFSVDQTILNKNEKQCNDYQSDIIMELIRLKDSITDLDSIRNSIFSIIGPESNLSGIQADFMEKYGTSTIQTTLFDDMISKYRLYQDTQKEIDIHVYGSDDDLAVFLRSYQDMIDMESATITKYEDIIRESIEIRVEALNALADKITDIDIPGLDIETLRAAAELTVEQFYGKVPKAFCIHTKGQLDSLYLKAALTFIKYYQDKDNIHLNLTAETDKLWYHFADFSEKLITAYLKFVTLLEKSRENLTVEQETALSDLKTRLSALENQLYLPAITQLNVQYDPPSMRYDPVHAQVSLGTDSPPSVTEYAFQFSPSTGYQAIGTMNQFNLDFYNQNLESGSTEYNIRARARNMAGMTVESSPLSFTVNYYDPESPSSHSYDIATDTSPPTFSGDQVTFIGEYTRETVFVPEQSISVQFDVGHDDKAVHIQWPRASDPQSGVIQYEVSIITYQGNDIVLDWTAIATEDTAHVPVPLIPYTQAYKVQVRAKNGRGLYSDAITSIPLVISSMSHVFPGDDHVQMTTRDYMGKPTALVLVPYAQIDVFNISGYGHGLKFVSPYNYEYQYQLLNDSQVPDDTAWNNVMGYAIGVDEEKKQINVYFDGVHRGLPRNLPFREPVSIAFRVLEKNSENIFVQLHIYNLLLMYDATPPTAVEFTFQGWNLNENLLLKITQPGEDNECGIAGMQFAVGRSEGDYQIRSFPQPNEGQPVMDFAPEYNSLNQTVVAPVQISSLDMGSESFYVALKIFNTQGMSAETVIKIDPPVVPQINAWVVFGYGRQLRIIRNDFIKVRFRLGYKPNSGDLIHNTTQTFYRSYIDVSIPKSTRPDSMYLTIQSLNTQLVGSPVIHKLVLMPVWPIDFQARIIYEDSHITLYLNGQLNQRALDEQVENLTFRVGTSQGLDDIFQETTFRLDEAFERNFVLPDSVVKYVNLYLQAYVINVENIRSPDINKQIKVPVTKNLFSQVFTYFTKDESQFRLHLEATLHEDAKSNYVNWISYKVGSALGQADLHGSTGRKPTDNIKFQFPIRENAIDLDQIIYITARGWRGTAEDYSLSDTVSIRARVPSVPAPNINTEFYHRDQQDYLRCTLDTSSISDQVNRTEFRIGTKRGLNDVLSGATLTPSEPENEWPLSDSYKGQELYILARNLNASGEESATYVKNIIYSALTIPQLQTTIRIYSNDETYLRFQHDPSLLSPMVERIEVWGGSLTGASDILSPIQFWRDTRTIDEPIEPTESGIERHQVHISSRSISSSGEKSPIVHSMGIRNYYDPIIDTISESENKPVIHISSIGFNGELEIAGYQYAIGSQSNNYDIHPLPQDLSTFDFTPDQIQAGENLILPESTFGMPGIIYIAIRAISAEGLVQTSEALLRPLPPTPVPEAWFYYEDRDCYFVLEVDPASVDQKVFAFYVIVKSAGGTNLIVWPQALISRNLVNGRFHKEELYGIDTSTVLTVDVWSMTDDGRSSPMVETTASYRK